MSNGEVRKVSLQDIQLVQNLIERCLQLYMSQKEVVSILLHDAKIEPGFTELVWQKLETENPDFFHAYNVKLVVKEQIVRFNELLEKQVELMQQICQTGAAPSRQNNGSQTQPMHNNSAYQAQALHPTGPYIKPEEMHQDINAVHNLYTNGGQSLQPGMQVAVDVGVNAGRIHMPANMVMAQNSNAEIMQGINGGMIKSEGVYTGDSPFTFGAEENLLEHRNAIREASAAAFNGGDPSSQALNEPFMEPEMNSLGFLGQIPRNFSLSDLTADFTNSTDILESYARSPFLGSDANFLDPQLGGEQQNVRRLDTISEGLSYEDFGSD